MIFVSQSRENSVMCWIWAVICWSPFSGWVNMLSCWSRLPSSVQPIIQLMLICWWVHTVCHTGFLIAFDVWSVSADFNQPTPLTSLHCTSPCLSKFYVHLQRKWFFIFFSKFGNRGFSSSCSVWMQILSRDLRSFEIRFEFESNFRFVIRFVLIIRFEIFESSAPSIVLCKETIGGG